MTHVELSIAANQPGTLKVDGFDLSRHVTREIRVEVDPELGRPALVHVVIAAHRLDVDIPDALLSAVQGTGE